MKTEPSYDDLLKKIKALEEKIETYQVLVENSPDLLYRTDLQGRITFISSSVYKLSGYSVEEALGMKMAEEVYLYPEERAAFLEKLGEKGHVTNFEAQLKRKDGSTWWASTNAHFYKDKAGEIAGVEGVTRDIGEIKAAERALRESEERFRLAFHTSPDSINLNRASDGLFIDINDGFTNILGYTREDVTGKTSLALNIWKDPQDRQRLVEALSRDGFVDNLEHVLAVEDYIRTATDLTKQLLGFARGGQYEVKPTHLNEFLMNSATMFGRTKKEIQIHAKLQEPSPVVDIDRSQMEQVLLNLFVNAWQAMPQGGKLYLESRFVRLDETYCKPHNLEPGRYVKCSITDTGTGMDEATRRKIFDPFFTTKATGRGTGLGLASAYGIIKNHRGIITVYSEVGHGTTFTIHLPLSDKTAYEEDVRANGIIKGSGTILLVDDEDMILDVGRAMLEKLGYRVIPAAGGEQALEAVRRMGDAIDLVVLDLIMPDIPGGRVFDEIRAIRPHMPVLLSSGYSMNGQAREILEKGCNGFLQKPFNLADLSQQIHQVMH